MSDSVTKIREILSQYNCPKKENPVILAAKNLKKELEENKNLSEEDLMVVCRIMSEIQLTLPTEDDSCTTSDLILTGVGFLLVIAVFILFYYKFIM